MNRIGDILVGAKAITPTIRDRALAHRGKSRIRIGTALLEVGGISEALLLRALSVQRQVPPASGQDVAEIRPDILRLVPGKLASRLFVIPFKRVGRVVSLAMRDPTDLPAVDEVSFLTGLQIQAHIALEVRISLALARHYGVDVEQRFLDLARRLDQPKPAAPAPSARPAAPPPPPPSPFAPATSPPPSIVATSPPPPPVLDRRERSAVPQPPGFDRRSTTDTGIHYFAETVSDPWAAVPDTAEPQLATDAPIYTEVFREARAAELEVEAAAGVTPAATHSPDTAPITHPVPPPPRLEPPAPAPPEPVPPAVEGPTVDSRTSDEIGEEELKRVRGVSAEEEAAQAAPTVSTVAAEEPAEEPPAEEPPEALDLVARLSRAESRDDIADAVLDAATEQLKRAALFIVQSDRVIGWAARPEPPEGFRSFAVKFSDPSLFTTLRNTEGFYAGPCPALPANEKILKALGSEGGAPLAVVPVTLRGKSVLFLLGEAEAGSPPPGVPPLRRLAAMTATALEIALLKNRLRQM